MMKNKMLLPFQGKANGKAGSVKLLLFFILTCSLFPVCRLWGKEFVGAYPAVIALQDIQPGIEYDIYELTGYEIIIPNNLGSPSVYTVKVNPPESVSPLKGYFPLPDTSWFSLSACTLNVEPYDTGRVRYKIKIPEGDEYWNQAYQVEINIVRRPPKKVKVATGVGLVLGINLEYLIETRPFPNKEPGGIIGVMPSQFYIVNPEYKSDTTLSFMLFNNDTIEHKYTIETYIPPPIDTLNLVLDIPLTPNFEWIPEAEKDKWLRLKKDKVAVKAGEKKKVELKAYFPDLGVPREELRGKAWEGIVAVVPEAGKFSRFVRVKFLFPTQ